MTRTVILSKPINADFGYEATLGGGASSYTALPGRLDEFTSPDIMAEELRYAEVESQNYRTGALHGARSYEFTIKLTLQSMEALYWAMGSDSFVLPDHTLSFSDTLPSMEFRFKLQNGLGHVFKGAKVKSLKLSIAEKAKVVAEIKFVAITYSYSDLSAVTITSPDETTTPFMFADVTSLLLNSTDQLEQARSIEISIDRDTELLYGLSSTDPLYPVEGARKTEINLEIYAPADDSALYGLFNNETEFATSIALQNADGDTVTISISKTRIFDYKHETGDKSITVPLTLIVIGDWTATVNDGTTAVYNS